MDKDHSRLLWRCRRGIREMDIVLQEFINQSCDTLSDTNKKAFSQLLDKNDLDILNWIMGKDEPENDETRHIIKLIRESRNIN
ncbi:MAG: succinate dehydrogenase assembly factor 2 [Proteobacteria bacterium]|nr:succinate dehydrogenase assembly factor 2 [Pseudomonadota bacterium]